MEEKPRMSREEAERKAWRIGDVAVEAYIEAGYLSADDEKGIQKARETHYRIALEMSEKFYEIIEKPPISREKAEKIAKGTADAAINYLEKHNFPFINADYPDKTREKNKEELWQKFFESTLELIKQQFDLY